LAVSGGVVGRAGGTTIAGISRATDVGFAPASSTEGAALGSAKRKRTPAPTATRAASATATAVATATSAPDGSAPATSPAIASSTRPPATRTTAPANTPAAPTSTRVSSGGSPTVGGCAMFPSDNPWNDDISSMPVDANSATYISSINATGGNGFLHADFGGGGAYGIPYIVVPANEPLRPINFTAY